MKKGFKSKKVVTRKDHKCMGCLAIIPKGTETNTLTGKDGGEISTAYYCAICMEVIHEETNCSDEWCEGDLKENYPEYYTKAREAK